MRQAEIGAALDGLQDDVKRRAVDLVRQYRIVDAPPIVRAQYEIALLKQAVDTPHRARAQVAAWIAAYNLRNGAGTAQTFLGQCLSAAGSSKTLAQVDAGLAALEASAQSVVNAQVAGATWEEVAQMVEAQLQAQPQETFDYSRLPIPTNYVTVWGDPW